MPIRKTRTVSGEIDHSETRFNGSRDVLVRKHAARELKTWMARVDDRFMGSPIDVDPHDAIIHAIRVTAGEVKYCDEQIRKLSEDELFERPLETSVQQLPSGKWVVIEEKRNPEVISRWV